MVMRIRMRAAPARSFLCLDAAGTPASEAVLHQDARPSAPCGLICIDVLYIHLVVKRNQGVGQQV